MSEVFPELIAQPDSAPASLSPNPGTIIIQSGGHGGGGGSNLGRIASIMTISSILFSYGGYMLSYSTWGAAALVKFRGGKVEMPGEAKSAEKPKASLGTMLLQAQEKSHVLKEKAEEPAKTLVQDTGEKAKKVQVAVVNAKDEALERLEALRAERAKQQAEQDAAERKMLLAKASELGIKAEEDWPLNPLRQAVQDAEQKRFLAEWRKRYNGSCPSCHTPLKVTTRGTGQARCPRCNGEFSQSRFRRLPPPMPRGFRGFGL